MRIVFTLTVFTTFVIINFQAKANLVLYEGDIFEYEFNTLPLSSDISSLRGGINAVMGDDLLEPGEILRVELFENNYNDSSFYSRDIGAIQSPTDIFNFGIYIPPPTIPWQDLQGVMRFTMLSGTMEIETLTIRANIDRALYKTTLSIPEPTTLLLLAVGGLLLRKQH